MSRPKSPLWEEFGVDIIREENGENKSVRVLRCPNCPQEPPDGPKDFETLAGWKGHMQSEHGGYTSSEIEQAIDREAVEETATEENSPQPKPSGPRKISGRNRELNDKLNEGLGLVLSHVMDGGLQAEQEKRLNAIRGELAAAMVGVRIDFEEAGFHLSGKWTAILSVIALFLIPKLPPLNLKELFAGKKAEETPAEVPSDATK